jgi:3-oxoadipate enol-lactonase
MELFTSQPPARLDRDGVEIAYWTLGEGEPILLITGLATPAASWYVLPTLLAEAGYQVIVVDNRDCGQSSGCEGKDYSIAEMAEDAVAVLDALEVDSTYLFGISMGGMIAQELVLNHPRRVQRLILVATNPGRPESIPPSAELLTAMFGPRPPVSPEEAMAQLLGKLMGRGFAENNRELLLRLAKIRITQGSDAAAFSRQWGAILGHSTWDRLPEIGVPTLVIHGREDPLVPFRNGEMIASRIPGAELVALDGVGHFVPLEASAETIGAITSFFPLPQETRFTGSST